VVVDVVDEFRHEPGGDPLWTEAWYFDVVAPDLSWAMYARFALCPNLGHAWWWSVIVRAGEPMLLVREQHLDLPRAFEVRGDGLWADLTCHGAMQRWQVNFEGIAVALDDPTDAYGAERGDRVPVEFEFDWDATAPPTTIADGYGQRCAVTGDVDIVGADPLTLAEPVAGYRDHTWGVRDWWAPKSDDDRVIVPHLEGGVQIEPVAGYPRRALYRAASTITEPGEPPRLGWAEWLLPP
jgi:hypothetical protein